MRSAESKDSKVVNGYVLVAEQINSREWYLERRFVALGQPLRLSVGQFHGFQDGKTKLAGAI